MLRIARIIAFAVVLVALVGCGEKDTSSNAETAISDAPERAPPDVGDITHFHGCTALPTREVSPYEACLVDRLRAECTPAADCVLTCMASPNGIEVGGGCDHVCFGYNVHHQWEERPKAMDECRDIARGQSAGLKRAPQSPEVPDDARRTISAVHAAAEIGDLPALRKLMQTDFLWRFGGDSSAERAIQAWRASPTKLKALARVTSLPCAYFDRGRIQCPIDAGVNHRAGFEYTEDGWRMTYFVAGD
jgi:hypothetical protein